MTIHRIVGDKVRVYRRVEGGRWHCATFIDGKEYRKSTKRKDLVEAKEFAVAWYKTLCDSLGVKHRVGKSFGDAAESFLQEYETINQGRRSPKSIAGHKDRLRLHLVPYFGGMPVEEITADTVRDYRAKRMTAPVAGDASWTPPASSTIHNEIVTLRMVLKAAQRHGWIDELPDLSDPRGPTKKTEPRPWFTLEEYEKCGSAWNKAPVIGVIGVQSGPHWHWGSECFRRSRGPRLGCWLWRRSPRSGVRISSRARRSRRSAAS